MGLDDLEQVLVTSRAQWREWLAANADTSPGIWLVRPRPGNDDPAPTYDEVVEEALCFGWIDSTIRTRDERFGLQLLTPRKPTSTWSASNKERLSRLIPAGLVTEQGAAGRRSRQGQRVLGDPRLGRAPRGPRRSRRGTRRRPGCARVLRRDAPGSAQAAPVVRDQRQAPRDPSRPDREDRGSVRSGPSHGWLTTARRGGVHRRPRTPDRTRPVDPLFVVAVAGVALGGLAQSVTGLGFALVAAPALIALLGPNQGVAVVVLLGTLASVLPLVGHWRRVRVRDTATLLVPTLVATPVVAALLTGMDTATVAVAAGVAVLIGVAGAMARAHMESTCVPARGGRDRDHQRHAERDRRGGRPAGRVVRSERGMGSPGVTRKPAGVLPRAGHCDGRSRGADMAGPVDGCRPRDRHGDRECGWHLGSPSMPPDWQFWAWPRSAEWRSSSATCELGDQSLTRGSQGVRSARSPLARILPADFAWAHASPTGGQGEPRRRVHLDHRGGGTPSVHRTGDGLDGRERWDANLH